MLVGVVYYTNANVCAEWAIPFNAHMGERGVVQYLWLYLDIYNIQGCGHPPYPLAWSLNGIALRDNTL